MCLKRNTSCFLGKYVCIISNMSCAISRNFCYKNIIMNELGYVLLLLLVQKFLKLLYNISELSNNILFVK